MAERRMFAKSVIGSARFLRMPSTSRLLYYDLGMAADDDGIVEAFSVMRTTGATEDDLRVLASKGFVSVMNEDLVTYIADWNRNNLIKKDRYHPSIYQEMLVKISSGTKVEPVWNPLGTQMEPEVRLGKDRLGKASLGKESKGADKPPAPTPLFGPELKAAFEDWLEYKREKREAYKPKGLQSLITQIEKQAGVYGESAVAGLIVESMSNGWKGIIWDRLEKKQPRHGPQEREKSWAELARELEAGKHDP